MYLLIQKEDIENLIDSQRAAIKLYFFFALVIFSIGIALLVFANSMAVSETTKTIINIGGAFISTLSGFPIKEVVNRKEKINTYHILKRHVIVIAEKGDEISEQDRKEILDLIMKIIKENALRL
jgi:hypothetical protein